MRNLYRLMVAAFAVVAATACSQFEEQDALPSGDENLVAMTISVGGEPTRTFISEDGNSLNWCENDKIAIFDGVGKREFTIVEGSIEGGYAEFEGLVDAGATKFFAVYPYEAAGEYDAQAGTVTAAAATAQQLAGENVADGAILSVAQFEKGVESFDFKTAVGYFRVDVTFDDITSIIVKGANIAGTATFNAAGEVQSISEGANQVTLTPAGDTFAKDKSYYVALLPGTSPAGEFSVMLTRAENEALEMTATKAIEIPRNGGFFLADYKLVKKLVIKDAASLQKFLATAHTLAASEEVEVTADIDLQGVELTGATSFAGTLVGNGHSLLNWTSNGVSLFETLSGTVKNLKFDSTCSLTPADEVGPFGFLAKTVAAGGVVSYCENHANITLNSVKYASGDSQTDDAVYFGALVGQNFGTIEHSKNSGDITITTTPETTGSSQRGVVYIGGVAGMVNNTDQLATDASFIGLFRCENSGDISYSIASGKKGGFLFMGGVVGGTPCEKITKAIPEKAKIDNCVNTGNISHTYPEGAIAIGGGTLNSNYTYLAGVVGYCEGSISNCNNGAQGNATLGTITLTTPTLEEDYVISRTTVGGVAGFVMAGGTTCNNYAPISVTGCFGKGNYGYSNSGYAGGGTEKGASVAGVIAQSGISTHFKDNTLNQCHNYGAITCNFNMADQQTPHYVGGCVAVSHLVTSNMTNSAAITVNTKGYTNYVGGVLGYTKYGSSNLTNNAAGNIDCNLNRDSSNDDQLSSSQYVGGVVGCVASGQTVATTINHSQYTKCTVAEGVTVAGKIFVGGVFGQGAITNDATNHSAVTLTTQTSTGEINLGGVAGDVLGASDDFENNGNVNLTAVDVATAYVGGLVGSGASELENSTNNNAVTVNATTNIDTLGLGGLCGESSAITLTSNTNNGALSTNAGEVLHIGGLVGRGAGAITASSCTNSETGTVTLNNTNLELTEVAAGGLCGRGTNKSVFTSCTNNASVSLTAKSATTGYLAGISAMPTNAKVTSSYATNAVSCTNTGDLYANFPATWYVGGAVAFGGCWSSTTGYQFQLTDNIIECDIEIDANPDKHFVGGLVGHSGQHIGIKNNTYTGNITVGTSTDSMSFTGGLFGAVVLSATSTNTYTTYYNYTLAENEVDCVISSSGYCAALIGGQYNSSTSTVKTAPIFKYIYDEDKPNKVLSGTTINSDAVTADNLSTFVRSSYADDTRFTVTEEGLPAGVVFE